MERRGTQTLGGIVAAVRERWLVVLVSTLVGTMLAFWIGGSLAASYASTAVVQVYSQGRPADMSTERLIAASDSVAADAASGLTWGITAAELQDATTVGNPQGSFLLTFEVRLPDPQEAARSANAFANAYLDSRRALLQETEGTEDVIAGFLVDPAEAPSEPSGVSAGLYAIGGLALGLLLGIVLALFVDRADPRVRSARRMQQLFYDDIFVTTDDPADASAMLAVLAHRAAQGDPSPSLALVGPDAELIGRLMPYFQRPILVPGVTPGANGEVGIRSVNAAAQPWESLQIATAAESDVSVIVATASDSRKRIISLHDHLVQVTGKPTVGWFIQTKRVRKRRRAVELRSSQQQKADREPRAPRTRTKQGAVQ